MIELRWYKCIPVPVIYMTSLLGGSHARFLGLFIIVRPEFKGTAHGEGLIVHEFTHCRQFYRSFGVNFFLYFFSKSHRFDLEIEAYRAEMVMGDIKVHTIVKFINSQYSIGPYTEEEVRAALAGSGEWEVIK